MTSVEAKTNFGAVLDAVESGLEVLVTRNGKEVARIVPVRRAPMSKAEAVARLATFADGRKLGMDWRKLRDEGRK
jgi:prevent-host-death family protein